MSVTYVDFRGRYRSHSHARSALESAERSLDNIESLCGCMSPSEWYTEACRVQKELNETHENIYTQFGREMYKKIVAKRT